MALGLWASRDLGNPTIPPEPPPPAPPAPVIGRGATRVKVSPEPFRTQIVRLEEVLFKLEPRYEDGWAVSVRGEALADAMLDERRDLNDQARTRAGIAMAGWAAMVGRQMDSPYRRPDWAEWKTQWERLRGEYFTVADWFASHDPSAPAYRVAGGPVPPAQRETARRLSDFALDVQRTVYQAQPEALAIEEPRPAMYSRPDAPTRPEQQWRDWSAAWRHTVDSLAARHDSSLDPAADAGLVQARAELLLALDDLRKIPAGGSPDFAYPQKYHRRQHFESALARVQKARDHLARVGSR
jgi:hypothetical protein